MSLVQKLADNTDKTSLAHRMRTKRFGFFLSLVKELPRPLSILDIGGTIGFWDAMEFLEEGIHITLLNLESEPVNKPGFTSISGDATQLAFADQSFDVVFSNSVIEHLFDKKSQCRMAEEVVRVGKHYFIQSPNYWFPLEPHWMFPFFQFLPINLRIWLTQHFSLGHIPKKSNREKAAEQVNEIRLLTRKEMQLLFPNAAIYREKLLGLNKSFVAYKF
jgi:2-polyprenyl-3-methyl-5-hydroxy-6-metoxy-1,4-benzoquinol methylase